MYCSSRPDVIVEKHCVFVTNLPPSSLPAVESIKYGGMTHFQLAELMCKVRVNLFCSIATVTQVLFECFMSSAFGYVGGTTTE